jgi:hypothetical protein
MRVMVIIKATPDSEAGVLPSAELLTAMGKFNEELVNAGVMCAADGLHPTSRAKRILLSGDRRAVVDGPFTESKEMIAGYWIWQVKSMDEAVGWAKRIPNPGCPDSEVDIRPIFELDDFLEAMTPALREHEERLRAQIAN